MGLSYFGDLALSLTIGYIGVFGFLCAAQIINHELFSKRSQNSDETEGENEAVDEGSELLDRPPADEAEKLNLLEKLDQALKKSSADLQTVDIIPDPNNFDGPSTSKAAVMRNRLEGILVNKNEISDGNATKSIKAINEPEHFIKNNTGTEENEVATGLKIKETDAELSQPVNTQIIFIEEEKKAEEHTRSKRSIEKNGVTVELEIEDTSAELPKPIDVDKLKIIGNIAELSKPIVEAELKVEEPIAELPKPIDEDELKIMENIAELSKPIVEAVLEIEEPFAELPKLIDDNELKIQENIAELTKLIEEAELKFSEPIAELPKLIDDELKIHENIAELTKLIKEAELKIAQPIAVFSEPIDELIGKDVKESVPEGSSINFTRHNEAQFLDRNYYNSVNVNKSKGEVQDQSHFEVENEDEELKGLEIRVQLYVPRTLDIFTMSVNQNNDRELAGEAKQHEDDEEGFAQSEANFMRTSQEIMREIKELEEIGELKTIYRAEDHNRATSSFLDVSLGLNYLDDLDQYIAVQKQLIEIEMPCEKKYSTIEQINDSGNRLEKVIDQYENYKPKKSEKSVEIKLESWRDEYGLLIEGVSDFYDFQASTNPSRSRNVSPFNSGTSSSNTQSPRSYSDISIRNEDKAAAVLSPEEIIEMRELVDSLRVAQRKLDDVNRNMEEIRRYDSFSPGEFSKNLCSEDGKEFVQREEIAGNVMQRLCVKDVYSQRRSRSRSPLPTENNLQKSLETRRSKLIQQNDEAFQKLGVKADEATASSIEIQIGEYEAIPIVIPEDTEIITTVPVLNVDVNFQNTTLLKSHSENNVKTDSKKNELDLNNILGEDFQNDLTDQKTTLLTSDSVKDIDLDSKKNVLDMKILFEADVNHPKTAAQTCLDWEKSFKELNNALDDVLNNENYRNTCSRRNQVDNVFKADSKLYVLDTIIEEEEGEEEEEEEEEGTENNIKIKCNFSSRNYFNNLYLYDEDYENIDDISCLSFDEELELSESECSECDDDKGNDEVDETETLVGEECDPDLKLTGFLEVEPEIVNNEVKEEDGVNAEETEDSDRIFSVLIKYKDQFDGYPLIENESESCLVFSDDESIEINKQQPLINIFTDTATTTDTEDNVNYRPKREYNWRKNFNIDDESDPCTSTANRNLREESISNEILKAVEKNSQKHPQEIKFEEKQVIDLKQDEKMDISFGIETDIVENFNTTSTIWFLTQEGNKFTPVSPYDCISSSDSDFDSEINESTLNPETPNNHDQNQQKVQQGTTILESRPKNSTVMEGLSDFYDFLRVESNTTSNLIKSNIKSDHAEIQIAVEKLTDNKNDVVKNDILEEQILNTVEEMEKTTNSDHYSSEDQSAVLPNVMESYDILKDANLYPFI